MSGSVDLSGSDELDESVSDLLQSVSLSSSEVLLGMASSGEFEDPVSDFFDEHHIVSKNRDTRESRFSDGLLVKRMERGHDTESQHANALRAAGVRYLATRAARAKYEVSLNGKVTRVTTGENIDTRAITKQYATSQKAKEGNTILGTAHWGVKPRQAGDTGSTQLYPVLDEWKGALIWVALVDKVEERVRFYTHVCKVDKFHHSSFGAGKSVAGAGEWVIEQGKLLRISANSGHYRPDLNLFVQSVNWMQCAFTAETRVLMFDTVDEQWIHRTTQEFLANPSGGGRYKVHPDAQ